MPEQKVLLSRLYDQTAIVDGSFDGLDMQTQDFIIDKISAELQISNTDAEDIARCLHYKVVPPDGYWSVNTYLEYMIPNFLIRKCLYD
jgi:hypothetical protein